MESQTCSNPDCQITENGSCLQGHDPVASCPNFGGEQVAAQPNEQDDQVPELAPIAPVSNMAQLPTGQPFSQGQLDTFLLQKPAHLVAIVGDTSSGKSTLLCALYDQFARGGFADLTFAGSATLMAFEKVAHYSRAVSGATVPDTERTFLSQGLQYYHLATVADKDACGQINLFMSDRAGETYRAGLDQPSQLLALQELRLARTVAVLIDGARLARMEEQHQVLENVRQLVRSMMDSGALNVGQHLQIVLTKRDEVERSGRAESLVANALDVVTRLTRDFGHGLASVNFYEIAARDPLKGYAMAFGCGTLLQSWINADEPQTQVVSPSRRINCHFDRLAVNQTHGAAT